MSAGVGFRIKHIWAALAVHADNDEGVCGFLDLRNGHWVPLVAADEKRLAMIRAKARELATTQQIRIRIVRFDIRTDIETVEPGKWPPTP